MAACVVAAMRTPPVWDNRMMMTRSISHISRTLVLVQVGKETSMAVTITDPIKILFAILLPPLGVFFEIGLTGHFWLNILLTLFGYIPGIVHALYVILRH